MMKLVVTIGVLATWLLASIFQAAPAQENAIRIGAVVALHGFLAAHGERAKAIYSARFSGQAAGGQNRPVELFIFDSGSDRAIAAQKLEEAIVRDRIVAAICYTTACIGPAEKHRVPTILTVPAYRSKQICFSDKCSKP